MAVAEGVLAADQEGLRRGKGLLGRAQARLGKAKRCLAAGKGVLGHAVSVDGHAGAPRIVSVPSANVIRTASG